MDSSANVKTKLHPADPHPHLNCPRCNSSNTKFCYYNNYNLSQPRHFCKACKRYWTRGGTLRNVPVGGGCRKKNKNKKNNICRVNSTTTSCNSSHEDVHVTTSHAQILDLSNMNPKSNNLFYTTTNNNNHIMDQLNFPFSTRVGFDEIIQPATAHHEMINGLGLVDHDDQNYSFFMGSNSSTNSTTTMASLLDYNDYQDMQQQMRSTGNEKELKMEGTENYRLDSSHLWNTNSINNVGNSWFEPSNIGSSLSSLI